MAGKGAFPGAIPRNNPGNSNWPTFCEPLNQPGQFPREVTEKFKNSNWPELNQPGQFYRKFQANLFAAIESTRTISTRSHRK